MIKNIEGALKLLKKEIGPGSASAEIKLSSWYNYRLYSLYIHGPDNFWIIAEGRSWEEAFEDLQKQKKEKEDARVQSTVANS